MVYALIFVIIILMMDLIITKIPKQEKIENEDLSSLYEKKTYLLTQNELKFYKLLKSITDKSVQIQSQEARNKDLMTAKFTSVKKQAREVRKGQNVVNKYYKNMTNTNYVAPQFMDNKN